MIVRKFRITSMVHIIFLLGCAALGSKKLGDTGTKAQMKSGHIESGVAQ
jgi:hypothetical protein